MKLTVYFAGKPFAGKDHPKGLGLVDMARDRLDMPELYAERISSVVTDANFGSKITLSEREARQCGNLFFDETDPWVSCGRGSLIKYVSLQTDPEVDPKTGEITSVKWWWRVKKEELIKDWIAAGAPKSIEKGDEWTT